MTGRRLGNDPAAHVLNMQTQTPTIRILLLNIRSLRNKVGELAWLADLHSPDIICVNETWLDDTVSDGEIALDGFNILRSDRKDQAGGGVCLYSKASLLVKPRMDLTESAIESCWGEIHCQSGTCLIGTIYRPPSEPVRYWDCLDDHLHSVIRPGKNVIICCDIIINTNPTAPPDPQLHYLSDLVASYSYIPEFTNRLGSQQTLHQPHWINFTIHSTL